MILNNVNEYNDFILYTLSITLLTRKHQKQEIYLKTEYNSYVIHNQVIFWKTSALKGFYELYVLI